MTKKIDHQISEREVPALKGIYLHQFQSIFESCYIEFPGITLLYGPNSAGKSCIIDALQLLKKITGSGDDRYYGIGYLWKEAGCTHSTALGLAVTAKELADTGDSEIQRWSEIRTDFRGEPHLEFMKAIQGKDLKVEFFDEGNGIKVAIDGKPLFEINTIKNISFTRGHKPAVTDDELDDADLEGRTLLGELVVHKKHPMADNFCPSLCSLLKIRTTLNTGNLKAKKYRPFDCPQLDLLLQEDELTTTLWGATENPRMRGNFRLEASWSLQSILLDNCDSLNHQDLLKEEREFLEKYFTKKSAFQREQKRARNQLYNAFQDIGAELSLILEGIIYQLRTALKYSHVSGDRKILDSTMPVFVTPAYKLSKIGAFSPVDDHLSNYAKEAASHQLEDTYGTIPGDFVNNCLSRHLHSLHGYKITTEKHVVKVPKANKHERNEIIFINVQNPARMVLGLQSVGSGLSYVLPILTSLWYSTLSFIEQPELHLHPAAQCELGDVFIAGLAEKSLSVVESHSEHLLLRLMRRIRETSRGDAISSDLKLQPDQVCLYYFHPTGNGTTVVKKIRIDKYGELLDAWPGGFFAERDRELFA